MKTYLTLKSILVLSTFTALVFSEKTWAQAEKSSKSGKGKKETLALANPPKTKRDIYNEGNPYEEQGDQGSIHWTKQYVECEGEALLDTQTYKSFEQAREKAIKVALFEARGKMESIVKGIYVEDQILLSQFCNSSEKLSTQVKKWIFNLDFSGEPQIESGTLKLAIRMPLYQNGIAPFLLEESRHNEAPEKANLLQDAQNKAIAKETSKDLEPPTKLVLLIEGGYNPRIFPKVLNPEGKIVFDFAQLFESNVKIPNIKRPIEEDVQAMGRRKSVISIRMAQNGDGNLVLDEDSYAKLLKWRALEKQFPSMIKGIYLL
jgi:hypothetical protein